MKPNSVGMGTRKGRDAETNSVVNFGALGQPRRTPFPAKRGLSVRRWSTSVKSSSRFASDGNSGLRALHAMRSGRVSTEGQRSPILADWRLMISRAPPMVRTENQRTAHPEVAFPGLFARRISAAVVCCAHWAQRCSLAGWRSTISVTPSSTSRQSHLGFSSASVTSRGKVVCKILLRANG
jgi:hypothetical protein